MAFYTQEIITQKSDFQYEILSAWEYILVSSSSAVVINLRSPRVSSYTCVSAYAYVGLTFNGEVETYNWQKHDASVCEWRVAA